MDKPIRIIGVHPIPASEPCHIVEIALKASSGELDFGLVTQEISNQPRDNWQVAYDERQVGVDAACSRWVFFFHDLNFEHPLLTPLGPITLPEPTPLPNHLSEIEYHEP